MTAQLQLKQQAYASNLKSRALSILVYLIDRSNKELTCFPAISTMAEQLHISISTVKRALHELVDCGFIKKDPRFREKNRGQTSNLYTLVMREDNEPTTIAPVPTIEDTYICTVEEKEAPKTVEQKKAHVITYISFADIAVKNSQQAVETTADRTPADEMQLPIQQPDTVKPTPKTPHSTPVHTPNSLIRFCRTVLQALSIRKCRSTFLRGIKRFQNKWTGAGVNLQPP